MGDAGDYWNDHREYRRRQRKKMVECAGCGRLEFPLAPCMRCLTVTDKYGFEVDIPTEEKRSAE